MDKSKIAIARMFSRMFGLTAVCCAVACSTPPSQGQSITALSPAGPFRADTANPPATLTTNKEDHSRGEDHQKDAHPLIEDFTQDSSLVLLQTGKPSGVLVDLCAGYGQFFPDRTIVPHSTTDEVEKPGWLYVKLRFTF